MNHDYLAAQGLLERCRAAGIDLTATDNGLEFDAPPGDLGGLLDELRQHKSAILELLRSDWPAWALEDTIGPDEFTESPAASRLRRRAAELRARRAKK